MTATTATSPVATPLLDEQICFALYNASRAITSRYREILAPLEITYPQYLVLLTLWEDGEASVSHLGERLHLDSGTLSPLLRRLESSGLIVRARAAHDERTVLVSLTAEGERMRGRTSDIQNQVCMATGLGPTEITELQSQIATLAAHVRDSNSPQPT